MSVTISLLGRLGRDAEIKQVGKSQVAQANVAVNHDRKNDAGEYETDWYRLNVWGNQAETFCKLFSKGKRVVASGTLEINQYTNQSGEVRETKDVRVTDFKVIDWGDEQSKQVQQSKPPQPKQPDPFSSGQQAQSQQSTPNFGRDSDPFSGGTPMNITDDSLPF
ncbi:putative Single-stranded DNA-binding protein 1 [Lactococcus piscium]|nr:putative Single-stranded DNA-binding protein 1 [Lactococcus piscium]